jgi:cell division protein FtsX
MTWKLALRHLVEKPFVTLFTWLMISVALMALGSFWLVVENLQTVQVRQAEALNNAERLPGLTVFVDPKLSRAEVDELSRKILLDSRFSGAKLVDSVEAMAALQAQFGEALSKAFGSASLPTTLKLQFAATTLSRDDYLSLLNQMRGIPGVLDVDDGLNLVALGGEEKLGRIFEWASVLLVLVFSVVALLVSHLIRIAFESLKPEIETLKVLGASRFWIFKPLALEGIVLGVLGAIGGLSLLWLVLNVVLPQFSEWLLPKGVELQALSLTSAAQLGALSLVAGIVGALFSYPLVHKAPREI